MKSRIFDLYFKNVKFYSLFLSSHTCLDCVKKITTTKFLWMGTFNANLVDAPCSLEELVSGALESSFWVMDSIILHDKETISFLLFYTLSIQIIILNGLCLNSFLDLDPNN
jgi:hypothetical protein